MWTTAMTAGPGVRRGQHCWLHSPPRLRGGRVLSLHSILTVTMALHCLRGAGLGGGGNGALEAMVSQGADGGDSRTSFLPFPCSWEAAAARGGVWWCSCPLPHYGILDK